MDDAQKRMSNIVLQHHPIFDSNLGSKTHRFTSTKKPTVLHQISPDQVVPWVWPPRRPRRSTRGATSSETRRLAVGKEDVL